MKHCGLKEKETTACPITCFSKRCMSEPLTIDQFVLTPQGHTFTHHFFRHYEMRSAHSRICYWKHEDAESGSCCASCSAPLLCHLYIRSYFQPFFKIFYHRTKSEPKFQLYCFLQNQEMTEKQDRKQGGAVEVTAVQVGWAKLDPGKGNHLSRTLLFNTTVRSDRGL